VWADTRGRRGSNHPHFDQQALTDTRPAIFQRVVKVEGSRLKEGDVFMAQRVAAMFQTRDAAERAADALVAMGADRGHISVMARGEDGRATTSSTGAAHSEHMVEPAREVGDSGAPLTTSDEGDAAKGAAIGAVAGLAAGLLALTVPGIGLVLAAGPLAAAMAGGAVAGGVYGGLKDIGIEDKYARGYEERIRGGHVLLTAIVPDSDQQRVRAVLVEHNADDISFAEDRSAAATAPSAAAEWTATGPAARDARVINRVDVDEEADVENVTADTTRRNI
jgi:hypothetical protein